MCVIDVSQKGDASPKQLPGQGKYVPWLVCMDTNGDKLDECNKQTGVDSAAVSKCMSTDAPALVKKYLVTDAKIKGTPTVNVNGKEVKGTYRGIHTAICAADPSLSGCSSNNVMPPWADWEPAEEHVPTVVV